MTSHKLHAAGLAWAMVITAPLATAQVTYVEPVVPAFASETTVPPRADDRLGSALSDNRLSAQRGGQDAQLSEIKAKSTVSENSAHHLTTGTNTITEGAFGHVSGMPMVIQNSGNNVSIQNSTVLNLQLR
jgi:hypothetical protein